LYAWDAQVQFCQTFARRAKMRVDCITQVFLANRIRGSQEGDRVRSNASGSKHSEYTFVLFGHE
ncbi:hypothetical protein T08_8504, partial [Trichinella sp. T8]